MGTLSVHNHRSKTRSHSIRLVAAGAVIALMGSAGLLFATGPASAIGTEVDLGKAGEYSVLGGASVTNNGPSVLNNDLGVSPDTAISGFPPGIVDGEEHVADAHAAEAQDDLILAYDAAAGQATDESIEGDLAGETLTPGVYTADSDILLNGTLELDAEGDEDAVFVFQIGSALTTASSSSVELINGARACKVFWQVESSATLGTDTTFIGNILALTSITANTGATVDGRALARNGSVTLDTNTFTGGPCEDDDGEGEDGEDEDGSDTDGTDQDGTDQDGTDQDGTDQAGTDTDGEGTDTDGEGTDTDGEGTDTDGEGTDTDGEGTDTDGEGTDTDGEGTDTDGEGTDTEGTDTEGTDTDGTDTDGTDTDGTDTDGDGTDQDGADQKGGTDQDGTDQNGGGLAATGTSAMALGAVALLALLGGAGFLWTRRMAG